MTIWMQETITLAARPRGCHLITAEVTARLPGLRTLRVGLCHLFIQHTSAALTLNERVEPEVRADIETFWIAWRRKLPDTPMRTKVPTTCRRTSRLCWWAAV